MEVDGYENPEAEIMVLLLEGGVEPTHSFDLRRGPRRISPPILLSQTLGVLRSLGGGGGCWDAGLRIYSGGVKVCEVELGRKGGQVWKACLVSYKCFVTMKVCGWLDITRFLYHCIAKLYKREKGN
jgi:hypothetical protein